MSTRHFFASLTTPRPAENIDAVSDKGERRGHFRGKPRPGRRVRVSFVSASNHGSSAPPQSAHTRNIGVGGAFIVTSAPPPVGTQVRLTIEMPNGQPLEVRAEVRWHGRPEPDQPGMGVRFAGLDVDQLLLLNEYFASLTPALDEL